MSAKRSQARAIASPSSSTGNGEGGSNNNDDHIDKKFKHDHGDGDDDDDDDDDEDDVPKSKRAGRRKIKIEYIPDKSRRHITFSKRKSGIMKKAYELSTLTGTQVLLLVVSETGLVYTFTTPKLQPLVTKADGKNLIQACLHAPDDDESPDDNAAADADSPEPVPNSEYDDRSGASPQGTGGSASQAQGSPSQASPQQQFPYQQQSSQQQGGYGSSSPMGVPGYPTYSPFSPAYGNYNMNGAYPSATNAQPGYGGQHWPQQGHGSQQSPALTSAVSSKGGRKGDN